MYQKTIPMQIITIMYNTYLKIVGTSFNRRNVAVSISLTKWLIVTVICVTVSTVVGLFVAITIGVIMWLRRSGKSERLMY